MSCPMERTKRPNERASLRNDPDRRYASDNENIALVFPAGAIVQSWAFKFVNIRPEVPSDPVKEDTYECGMVTRGPALTQFNFRFYYVALLFLLFDVEIVFLFPWAVVFEDAGIAGLGKIAIFVGTFVVGGLYAWRKRALEWN